MLGFDTEHRIETPQLVAMRQQGYQFAVFASTQPRENAVTRANLYDADQCGYDVGVYTFPRNGESGASWVDRGLANCGNMVDKVLTVMLDCETVGSLGDYITQDQIVAAIQRCIDLGFDPLLYSAYWWWAGNRNNAIALPVKPRLANASYTGTPDIDSFRRLPYGPWTLGDVVLQQFAGTTEWPNGNPVDLDFVRDEWIVEQRIRRGTAMAEDTQARADVARQRKLVNIAGVYGRAQGVTLQGYPLAHDEWLAVRLLTNGATYEEYVAAFGRSLA